MSTETLDRFARKATEATRDRNMLLASAATIAADPAADAARWAEFANKLAEAEGKAQALGGLHHALTVRARKGEEITAELVKSLAFNQLAMGADDSWSGRGNDNQRARFDGVRAALRDAEFII